MKNLLSILFVCSSLLALAQFGEQQLLTAPVIDAQDVITADFDNDGDPDVLFTSKDPYTDVIVWHENDGTGTFGQPHIIENSGKGSYPAAADIDGDGDIDIACVKPTGWAWFSNDGFGNFTDYHFTPETDCIFTALIVLDIDNDGQLDILATGSNMVLYKNNGNGIFNTVQIGTVPSGGVALFAAHMNADSYIDVLCASLFAGQILLYANDGAGGFNAPQIISSAMAGAYCVAAGDLDGDGDNDVVAGASFDDKVSWFVNNGDGTYGTEQVLTTQADDVRSVTISDIDGDGNKDIISASLGDSRIRFFFNSGGGVIGTAILYPNFLYGITKLVMTDINMDNAPDIVASYYLRGGYLNNNGDGTFGTNMVICPLENTAEDARSVCTADVDNDGDNDVISASYSKVAWYENLGNGHFAPQQIVSDQISLPLWVYTADLDQDGTPEVYAASVNAITCFERQTDGSWTTQLVISQGASYFTGADMDGDADTDFVSISWDGTGIFYYENTGSGTFGPQQVLGQQATVYARDLCLTDIDNDGDNELVAAHNHTIFYMENQGGAFGAPVTITERPPNSYVIHVAAKDIDHNGLTDIVWLSDNYAEINYMRNNGDHIFTLGQPAAYAFGGHKGLLLEDFDGDSDPDIISSQLDINVIIAHKNNGNVFETENAETVASTSHFPMCMVMSDLDNDGDKDLICASSFDQKIAWYENTPLEYTLISGTVFLDANENQQQDTGEPNLAGIMINNSLNAAAAGSGQNGQYTLALLDNPQNLTIQAELPAGWAAVPATRSVVIDGAASPQTAQDFGLHVAYPETAGYAQLAGGFPRCNTVINYWINVHNTGSTTPSGIVELELDTAISYVGSSVTPDSVSGQHIYWNLDTLDYFTARQIVIQVQMPDYQNFGQAMVSYMTTTLEAPDTLVFADTLFQTLVCAYDPNDKSVIPSGFGPQGAIAMNTEELDYTVRFQNTGNDTAMVVVIQDQLDSRLDWETFELLTSSHPVTVTISQTGIAEFRFEGIHLPDSNVNELASHGFVNFRIHLLENQSAGTVITNTANIYFDQNPAVVTNTTTNTLFQCVPYGIDVQPVDPVCEGMEVDVTIYNLPNTADITWTIDGVEQQTGTIFHWVTDTSGSFQLHLQVENGECDVDVYQPLGVYEMPQAQINGPESDTICLQNGSLTLPEGIPAGGDFSGTGVWGTLFDPVVSGTGDQLVTYTYSNANGCTARDSIMVTVENCLGIPELNENDLLISPNPIGSGGDLAIRWAQEPTSMYSLTIESVIGEVVYSQSDLTGSTQIISLPALSCGMYLIRITNDSGRKITKQLRID
jgi:uncharacterized repeat protein (TIGR01451 family)